MSDRPPSYTEPTSPLLRLTRRSEFLRVASEGRKIPAKGVVVQAMPRPGGASLRIGFTVTKKVGNAVTRNRTKRRLREAARLFLSVNRVSAGDIVLIGREGTRARPFDLLIADIEQAIRRAGL